jgi:hypothetical protein
MPSPNESQRVRDQPARKKQNSTKGEVNSYEQDEQIGGIGRSHWH